MMLIPLKNELKWCILVCLELLTDPVTQLLSATEVQGRYDTATEAAVFLIYGGFIISYNTR